MREKETSPFLYFYFYSFGFWMMILEQAALTHDIERIFRSKKKTKRRRRQAAHGSIDIASSLDICDGKLIPRRHKEGHVRQLSKWDA